jgi:hypothetical protein
MTQKIGNIIEQMQTTMDGMLERLAKLEGALVALKQSRKPSVYIDEQTALLSSEDADIRFIARKVAENELSQMREQDRGTGNTEDGVL